MHQEIKEVFCYITNLMEAYRDMGFDPPPIRSEDIAPMEKDEENNKPSFTLELIDSLEALAANIGDCRLCKLHNQRRHLVFGEGNQNASLVFVGEGPGMDEDLSGQPFVGEAGKLLTRIIENGMGLSREDVYICNVVKCHPPKNRDPEQDEIETCMPSLKKQISIIKPKVICALGRIAGRAMLGEDFKISRDRGKWFSFMDIPLLATYHPAYVLRYPTAKRQVWDDVKEIMRHLGLEVKNV